MKGLKVNFGVDLIGIFQLRDKGHVKPESLFDRKIPSLGWKPKEVPPCISSDLKCLTRMKFWDFSYYTDTLYAHLSFCINVALWNHIGENF